MSCSGRVGARPVLVRWPVNLTPANLGHYIFRSHRQATLSRSHAYHNHGAADDQLRRERFGHRGHGVPCRLFLAEPVPRKKLSRRHVSASAAAMECLPQENTQADKRRCLRRRLMSSPVPSSRRSSQVATGSGVHSPSGQLPTTEHPQNAPVVVQVGTSNETRSHRHADLQLLRPHKRLLEQDVAFSGQTSPRSAAVMLPIVPASCSQLHEGASRNNQRKSRETLAVAAGVVPGPAVSGRLSALSVLTGRLPRQPAPRLRSGHVHVIARRSVKLAPANLGNCIFRYHRQPGTLARSYASENHGAVEDQLRRQQCGRRGHCVPCQVFLGEPVPSKKRSHRLVSTDSKAIECLPPVNTRVDNRRRLRQRLMPSTIRHIYQVSNGSGRHPPRNNKDNFRHRSNRTKFSVPGGNPEQDAQPLSLWLAEATATQRTPRPGGRCGLRTKILPVGYRHGAHRVRPLQPVARRWLSEEPTEAESISSGKPPCAGRGTTWSSIPPDFGIRRATTGGGESSLLDWPYDTSFGTKDIACCGYALPATRWALFLIRRLGMPARRLLVARNTKRKSKSNVTTTSRPNVTGGKPMRVHNSDVSFLLSACMLPSVHGTALVSLDLGGRRRRQSLLDTIDMAFVVAEPTATPFVASVLADRGCGLRDAHPSRLRNIRWKWLAAFLLGNAPISPLASSIFGRAEFSPGAEASTSRVKSVRPAIHGVAGAE
ncbi:hypothetical protein MTO96_016672 [Rhipicephalus appendiculatus]